METALAVRTGSHLDRAPDSFATLSDEWLAERKSAGVREITRRGYVSKLRPAMEAFGEKRVQEITRHEVKALVRSLDHLGISSVRQTVYCLKSVFALAVENEIIASSPAQYLKAHGKPAQRRQELSKEGFDAIREFIVGDRLELCWLLTLYGLRRSEIHGLKWSDFDGEQVFVQRGRVETAKANETTPTKSAKSRRPIPLTSDMQAAYRRTRRARQEEVLALGGSWDDDQLVAVTEALLPLHPATYSRAWLRMLEELGLDRVSLHSARHGSVSRLLNGGMPPHQVMEWHGHSNLNQTMQYAHVGVADLRAAAEAVAAR